VEEVLLGEGHHQTLTQQSKLTWAGLHAGEMYTQNLRELKQLRWNYVEEIGG